MKRCPKCNTEKLETEFSFKSKSRNILSPYCKVCNKEYNKEHYKKNVDIYKAKARKYELDYKKKIYTWIRDYCLEHPCIDCGENNFVVIHFDHIKEKNFEISKAISLSKPMELIQNEIINQCVPRCANCHTIRTSKQFNWYSFLE